MTVCKPPSVGVSTVAKTSKQRLKVVYERERQRRAEVRASLPPEDRAQFDVVDAQFNLERRRKRQAQAVIHCPVGTRLLQTECDNNMQRAWYFRTDADTGEEWCICILASTHYLNRTHRNGDDNAEHWELLADTVVRHAHNQPAGVALADRVRTHLLARRPLKVFRRCPANEMEAVGYGRPQGEGSAFVQTTVYTSVAALTQAYPVLAKPGQRSRAENAVGHAQVRFRLDVRTTPWCAETTTDSLPMAQYTPSAWSDLVAAMSAAK